MLIEQITLQNIKSYGSSPTTITFGPGVNLIAGPNGAGKSTILEAIGLVLFNTLPYNHSDFLRRGKVGTAKITVRIHSAYDDRVYDVERTFPSRFKVIDVEDNRDETVSSQPELLGWLCQHLQVEDEADLVALFRNAVGVQQGTMTSIFLARPSDRKPTFDALLRVQDFEKAWSTLAETGKYIADLISYNEKEIARREGQTERLPELKATAEKLKGERQCKQEALQAAEEQFKVVKAALDELDRLRQQLDELDRQIGQANTKIEQLGRNLKTAQENYRQSAEAADIVHANEKAYQRYRAAEKWLAELEEHRKQRDALVEERRGVESKLTAAKQELDHIAKELGKVGAAEAELAKLEPLVRQQDELEAAFAQAQEKQKERSRIEKQVSNDNAKLESLKALIAELRTGVEKRRGLSQLADQCGREANELLTKQGKLLENRNELQSALDQAQANLIAAERRLAEYQQWQKSLNQEQAALEKLQDARKTTIAEFERRQDLGKEIDELHQKIKDADRDRERARSEINRIAHEREKLSRNRKLLGEEGAVCPVCQRVMDHGSHEEAIHYFSDLEEKLNADEQRANATIEGANKLIDEWESAKTALEQQCDRLASQDALKVMDQHIGEIQEDIYALVAQAAELAEVPKAHAEAEAARNSAKEALDELQSQVDELTSSHRELVQIIDGLRQQITGLPSSDELDRQTAALNDLVENVKEAETQLKEFAGIDDELQQLEQDLTALEDPKQQQAVAQNIANNRAGLEALQQEQEKLLSQANSELDSLDEKLKPFAELDAQLNAVQNERADNADGYELYVENIKIAELLEERTTAVQNTSMELEHETKQRDKWSQERNEVVSHFDSERYESLRAEREELTKNQATLSAEERNLQDQWVGINGEISQLETIVVEISELAKTSDRLRREKDTLDFSRENIRAAGPRIRQRKVQIVSEAAAEYFSEIMRDFSMHLSWNPDDYGICVEQSGKTRPFAVLSGGEQMVGALAVRLALLKHMTHARVIFLDEPTINLDEDRRGELAERLREIQGLHQLFVISHDDTFSDKCNHIISVSKVDGESHVEPSYATLP